MKLGWLVIAAAFFANSSIAAPVHVKSLTNSIDITTEKVSMIIGEVAPMTADLYDVSFYRTMHMKGDRLILIDSEGGSSSAGDRIIATMLLEKSMGTRIVCFVTKLAASMAFNILTNCDVRMSAPNSRLLFHRLAFEHLDDKDERLTAERLRELAQELDEGDEAYARANAKALKMKAKEYFLFADKDHYWYARQLFERKYLHALGVIVAP